MVRKVLSTYFDRLNRKYESRGIEWYVHDNHYWIEVRVSAAKAEAYRKITNYDPRAGESEEE